METTTTAKPKKQSFALPADLEQRLHEERARFERAHGVPVSLNAVAVKAMRDGLARITSEH